MKNHKKTPKSNVEKTRESQEGSLPNFIKSADNTFLIKGNGLKFSNFFMKIMKNFRNDPIRKRYIGVYVFWSKIRGEDVLHVSDD